MDLLAVGVLAHGPRQGEQLQRLIPVWSASGDLAAGTVLGEGDLVAVQVRLDDVAGQYLATSTQPEGRVLGRAVRAGELLPRSALEEATGLVQLALPVQAGYVPPSLARGQVVDVYAVADPAVGASAQTGGDVDLVVSAAPVQAVTGRGDGVLSSSTTTVQVVVAVAAEDAAGVLGAIGGRGLVVVVRDSVDADEDVTPAGTAPAGPTG
ncbi:SAF domain-containing protein [Modestobacter versicolor]|uniref:SAF domain-containing protein n=1 Tax=Modestobacter versicolor TaxID=429133 RepID=UPI002815DD96|nr:SAF domain-containing protein [Modestobacter versicolor]